MSGGGSWCPTDTSTTTEATKTYCTGVSPWFAEEGGENSFIHTQHPIPANIWLLVTHQTLAPDQGVPPSNPHMGSALCMPRDGADPIPGDLIL